MLCLPSGCRRTGWPRPPPRPRPRLSRTERRSSRPRPRPPWSPAASWGHWAHEASTLSPHLTPVTATAPGARLRLRAGPLCGAWGRLLCCCRGRSFGHLSSTSDFQEGILFPVIDLAVPPPVEAPWGLDVLGTHGIWLHVDNAAHVDQRLIIDIPHIRILNKVQPLRIFFLENSRCIGMFYWLGGISLLSSHFKIHWPAVRRVILVLEHPQPVPLIVPCITHQMSPPGLTTDLCPLMTGQWPRGSTRQPRPPRTAGARTRRWRRAGPCRRWPWASTCSCNSPPRAGSSPTRSSYSRASPEEENGYENLNRISLAGFPDTESGSCLDWWPPSPSGCPGLLHDTPRPIQSSLRLIICLTRYCVY